MGFGPLPPPPSRDWRSDDPDPRSGSATPRPLEPAGVGTSGWSGSGQGGGPWQPPDAAGPGSPTAPSDRPVWADAGPPPAEPSSTDGVAIAALVLGILGLLTSVFVFGGVLGLIAVVLGVVGMRRGRQRGLAIAGVVTGVLAILVSIVVVALGVALFRNADTLVDDFGVSGLTEESPCAGAADVSSFPASLSDGGLTISAVEVCADSFDDFEYGVQVANDSDAPIDAEITVSARDGSTTVSEPAPESVTLEPGQEGWLRIISFDDYAPVDAVDVEATTS